MQKKVYSVEEAKRKLEYYCAYQERCHQEVEKKLDEMNMIPASKEVIIIHLIENEFLDEGRYAKAFVSGKFRIKKWGKYRLKRELKLKDISDYNIKQALQEINDFEYQTIFDELAKKGLMLLKEDERFKKRRKLTDYLLYRGWESNMVYKKVEDLIP